MNIESNDPSDNPIDGNDEPVVEQPVNLETSEEASIFFHMPEGELTEAEIHFSNGYEHRFSYEDGVPDSGIFLDIVNRAIVLAEEYYYQ